MTDKYLDKGHVAKQVVAHNAAKRRAKVATTKARPSSVRAERAE